MYHEGYKSKNKNKSLEAKQILQFIKSSSTKARSSVGENGPVNHDSRNAPQLLNGP
jgi:hypothetical protein